MPPEGLRSRLSPFTELKLQVEGARETEEWDIVYLGAPSCVLVGNESINNFCQQASPPCPATFIPLFPHALTLKPEASFSPLDLRNLSGHRSKGSTWESFGPGRAQRLEASINSQGKPKPPKHPNPCVYASKVHASNQHMTSCLLLPQGSSPGSCITWAHGHRV